MIYKVYTESYVAAIVDSTVKLSKFLQKVPERTLNRLKIEQLHAVKGYPFELVEGEVNGKLVFIPSNDSDLTKGALANMGMKIIATYRVEKDFMGDPVNPGLDYMGALDHRHEDEV